eukprot:TRINITY_DN7516_c0_g1_i1.p1 TRINITY_DN7516_c0_g1~~TRINITY_DN7516_c0_g1_i1.p1  ORF type:complete len:365 (+),score=52.32 TRINITY_DN7516_c0_g1_i1:82-1095(+)
MYSNSFFSLLRSPQQNISFCDFLIRNNQAKSLNFVLDVELYRTIKDDTLLKAHAKYLYKRYKSKNTLQGELYPAALKKVILQQPDVYLFDSYQTGVVRRLESEWVPKFSHTSSPITYLKNEKIAHLLDRFIQRVGYLDGSANVRSPNTDLFMAGDGVSSSQSSPALGSRGKSKRLMEHNLKKPKETRSLEHIPYSQPASLGSLSLSPDRFTSLDGQTTLKVVSSFEELLLEPNYFIMSFLCDTETIRGGRDELFDAVVTLLVHNDLIVPFLKQRFRTEINASTIDVKTLFRSESSAVKVLSRYFWLEGKNYVSTFVRPLLARIAASGSLEVFSDFLR